MDTLMVIGDAAVQIKFGNFLIIGGCLVVASLIVIAALRSPGT